MNLKTWYSGGTYTVLLLRLIIVLLLLLFSRILIYCFNMSMFPDLGFWKLLYISFIGLRFDILTLAIFNIPYILFNSIPFKYKYNKIYQLFNDILFFIINILALFANFIDVVYIRFTQKRMTFDIFDFINETSKEVLSLLPNFILDFWFPFILWIIFSVILVILSLRIKVDNTRQNNYRLRNYLIDSVKFVVVIVFLVIAGRGGLQYKPLNIVNAGDYTEPRYFPIILNTPYTIIKTKDEFAISEKKYFKTEDALEEIYSPVMLNTNRPGDFNKQNVIIIILESFTSEHSAYLNPHPDNNLNKGYTPFLDSLMKHSLVFRGYANGEKSIDAIPAIISGIPSLMSSPYILSPYVSNDIYSIAGLLKDKGYSTAFYHGGSNGTMSFEAFTKIAGFDKYVGRNEYANEEDFDGKWGIFDEEFLQFAAESLNQTGEPFFTTIFTLSSHHPYTIPGKYKGKFPKGKLPIHESIGYTDYSLKLFFDAISKMPWFDNTLFVLTADHTYQAYFPFYKTSVGRYSIPMVFYHPGENWKSQTEQVAQQTDIMPSVLDYLNYEESYLAFGKSVFDSTAQRFAISYLSGIYQLIKDNYILKFDGEMGVALYDLENDSLLKHNLIKSEDSVRIEMSKLSKAIIQQFNRRVIHNELTVKN